jgi:hypothetical protein
MYRSVRVPFPALLLPLEGRCLAAANGSFIASGGESLDRAGAGLPTGFAVPVLETGSPVRVKTGPGLDRSGAAKYHEPVRGE